MIRIKHIDPDGRVDKSIDLTPDSPAADIKAAHVLIDALIAEDKQNGNTLGIIAPLEEPKEVEA